MTRMVGAALAVAVAIMVSPLLADTPPSAWDLARDPEARATWEVHARAMQRESIIDEMYREARAHSAFAPTRLMDPKVARDAGLALIQADLEDVGAATSHDVRLRFDLGEIYERLDNHERAVDVLKPALEMAPDHPSASDAWSYLAYAYAHLDRSQEEIAAYKAFLARETADGPRATMTYNLADAEMRMGLLDEAIPIYREAIEMAVSTPARFNPETEVLATWGLAVALDRSGDLRGAEREALQAAQMDTGAILDNQDDVFFVPAYDRHWYEALRATVRAEQEPDARRAAWGWAAAEVCWTNYLKKAGPQDRWIAIARARLARTRAARTAAERRVEARPTPPVGPGGMFVP